MKTILTLIMLFGCLFTSSAQTITGDLSLLANQTIKLEGFNGLKTYPIATTTSDAKGNFKLNYATSDYGMGYLMCGDSKPLFVILSGEDIALKGASLSAIETIQILKGQENQWFEQYALEHPRREQALSAWLYLEKMYTQDAIFAKQKAPSNAIQKEKVRIKEEDAAFLSSLPSDAYVHWFLPTRKLVSSVATIAQYRPEEIPETIAKFRNLDYSDPRLYKSGLYKDAIEGHFWLLENSGQSLEGVFDAMKISIDTMMKQLVSNEKIWNEATDYLFVLLERQSLFQASEYLALKVLNEASCTLDNDLARQLETYRAMKKGNIAPDIEFEPSFFANQQTVLNKLSDLKSDHTLVVFGASWCPKCSEELPQIAGHYTKWKAKGVEVVFVALEEDRTPFLDFAKSFPFPSYSDKKKWLSKIVTDYHVFATPTMFLLDNQRQIILRPNTVQQMDAWVDWYLK